jgi:mannose-1-phosphate guanylyltransferase
VAPIPTAGMMITEVTKLAKTKTSSGRARPSRIPCCGCRMPRCSSPIVITNAAYRFMVVERLAEIGIEADVLLEPAQRDSGPAIAAGAAFARARDGEAVVLALAADHVVRDTNAFLAACRDGLARGLRQLVGSSSLA